MSLSDLLGIARSSLLAQQRALGVTAHNIANAYTPGYSRQSLRLRAAATPILGAGTIGSGIADQGISRVRDRLYDMAYWRQSGDSGRSDRLAGYLDRLESVIGEPSSTGVAAALDDLFAAFGDLASDPSSLVHRDAVVSAADRLTQRIRQLDTAIEDLEQSAAERITQSVAAANDLLQKLADLNGRILSIRNSGGSAPDLEDQRDRLVDELSQLVSVEAVDRQDGSVDVRIDGRTVVQGAHAESLTVEGLEEGSLSIRLASGRGSIDPGAGSLEADLRALTDLLPSVRSRLDTFAEALVQEVNEIHRRGYTMAGLTGQDFFDADGITAGEIRVAAEILESSEAIAAGESAEPGDNGVAQRLAGLADEVLEGRTGGSLRGLFQDFVGYVGTESRRMILQSESDTALLQQADAARQSVSGVSMDEEMVRLISQQEAYSAAARLVQIASELMDQIISLR